MTIEAQRAARRAAMPITSALLEEYAEWLPKVIYASEKGITVGKPPQYAEVFTVPANYEPSFQIPKKERK